MRLLLLLLVLQHRFDDFVQALYVGVAIFLPSFSNSDDLVVVWHDCWVEQKLGAHWVLLECHPLIPVKVLRHELFLIQLCLFLVCLLLLLGCFAIVLANDLSQLLDRLLELCDLLLQPLDLFLLDLDSSLGQLLLLLEQIALVVRLLLLPLEFGDLLIKLLLLLQSAVVEHLVLLQEDRIVAFD